MAPRPLPGILEIEPYKGGEAATPGHEKPFKLSSNENALGASAAALAAYRAAADTLALYPDGAHAALRRAIAAKYGLNPERIVCTAGSDEVFQLLGRAYLGRGDAIVQSQHAFLVYRLVAQQAGAETISVPDRALRADVDGMLAAVTPRTRIVFLANPNNPTGTYLPFEEVRRLHAGLPGDVLLVLDGAYAEFVRRNDYSSGLELAAEHDNVLMTRTFSKIHGLAALRVGWAYGPQTVIDALNRVRGPFNVSGPALAAAAAAIEDHAFQEQSAIHNEHWLGWLSAEISRLGYPIVPSVGNFLLIDFGSAEAAAHADAFLRSRGLILRSVKAYGLSTYLRLSVGSEEANRRVVAALAALKAS